MALVLLLLGFIGPGIERAGPARAFVPEGAADAGRLSFANGLVLDTRVVSGAKAGDLLPGGSMWLAILDRPPDAGIRSGLRHAGLEPLGYYHPQTIVCRSAGVRAGPALAVSGVRWLGRVRPEAKLAPELLESAPVPDLPVVVSLWPGADPAPVLNAVVAAGGRVERAGEQTIRFRPAGAGDCRRLAELDEVQWLQASGPVEEFNAGAQWVVQSGWRSEEPDPVSGRPVWRRGIRGQGMVAGNVGSGLAVDHEQFLDPVFPLTGPGVFPTHRKVAAYKLYPEAEFGDQYSHHGSGVAGSLCGNDSVSGNLVKCDGMAPDARVYFLDVANVRGIYVFDSDYTELLDSVRLSRGMSEPVTQLSGAFGSSSRTGYYRLEEATLDNVTWQEPEFLVVWAAGNSGGSQFRVAHPGCAKNCLTVGATGNGTASDVVADFSSRGPTRDLRIKPEVVAPGRYLTTVTGPGPRDYASRSGTSFAAPVVHGALVLVNQYLRDGWFPSGRPEPGYRLTGLSSAMYRALAILAADPTVEIEPPPSNAAGWGRLDLSRLLHFAGDSNVFSMVDEPVGLGTASYHEYRVLVRDSRPLTVVLAWTDTAAAPEIDVALVNDLDLELVSPDGNRYYGNRLIDGQSSPNPATRDDRNSHELFHLRSPMRGEWSILVRARSVFTDRQPYALALRGTPDGLPGIAGEPAAAVPMSGSLVRRGGRFDLRLTREGEARVFAAGGRLVTVLTVGADGRAWWDTGIVPTGVYFIREEDALLRTPGRAWKVVLVD
ncbi:MAG: S8 family serine peptidase [bacterium]